MFDLLSLFWWIFPTKIESSCSARQDKKKLKKLTVSVRARIQWLFVNSRFVALLSDKVATMNWNQAYLYEKNFKNRTEEREREEEKADDKEEDDKDEKISLFHSYFWGGKYA